MQKSCIRLTKISFLISMLFPLSSLAESESLDEIQVTDKSIEQKLGQNTTTQKELEKNLVQDIHDMVRYNTAISVVDGGRVGSNGFTIRGVDQNRVAISVDGLAQAESRSSEGFQLLFGGYGNYNTNRNEIELENISQVDVIKGADSVQAGSGALGGAVLYKSKSAKDYLSPTKNYYLGAKTGYSSKNSQKINSITLAGQAKGFDTLFVYTERNGKETKNYGDGVDQTIEIEQDFVGFNGIFRATPDPQKIISKSTLIKLGYHFNPENYLSLIFEDQRQERKTDELSNLWLTFDKTESRHRDDVTYRKRIGLSFENSNENKLWDKLKFDVNRQKIALKTLTFDLPKEIKKNSEVYLSKRGLYQDLDQIVFNADKFIGFDTINWLISYGGGLLLGKNTNDNNEFKTYIYAPSILASDVNHNENLIQAKNKQRYFKLSNTISIGEIYRLYISGRYDKYNYATIPDINYNKQLAVEGLLDATNTFSALSYSLGGEWNIYPNLTLQAKYNSAFRAPTIDELWFSFKHKDIQVLANPELKPEKANNIELGLVWQDDYKNIRLSAFYTKYHNFIDFAYLGQSKVKYWDKQTNSYKETDYEGTTPTYKNLNRRTAKVKGIEFEGIWKMENIGFPKGIFSSLAATYIKGVAESNIPINEIQPFNATLGLGYEKPNGQWRIITYLRYLAQKKPKDTIHDSEDTQNPWPYVKFSKDVLLVDLIGDYKFTKYLTLRAGVFNLFNRKYYDWNSLRSIREFGTVNRIDDVTFKGIDRFSAPGRNFGLTLTFEF